MIDEYILGGSTVSFDPEYFNEYDRHLKEMKRLSTCPVEGQKFRDALAALAKQGMYVSYLLYLLKYSIILKDT